jgi:hydrogenase maturation protein HypF
MGRWFDAVGSLVLGLSEASFEGHVAIALEEAASSLEVEPYPLELPSALATVGALGPAHEIDLRPLLRAVLSDVLGGVSPGLISARFHRSIVEATAAVTVRVLQETGLRRAVLSGGSFQNRLLEQGVLDRLGPAALAMAREVPVNDGGLALGQAWAAALVLSAGE